MKETNDEKPVKRQTIHMPAAVHDQLREIAFFERTTQQELIREGMDLMFKAHGKKTWAELTKD